MSHRVVYYEPYRAFYQPVRMDYYQYTNVYQTNNHYYNKSNFYRPGQQVASYNYGRRTTAERDLSPAVRSNQNVSRDYASNNTNNKTAVRSNATSGRNSSGNNVSRERANVERHEAAVRAQRGNTPQVRMFPEELQMNLTGKQRFVPKEVVQPISRAGQKYRDQKKYECFEHTTN
jgi:hypothetical protein